MLKKKTIFFLGIWLIILPFLGFPDTIRKILTVATGFSIAVIAYFLVKQKRGSALSMFFFDERTDINERDSSIQ